jgi:hypothetical protein
METSEADNAGLKKVSSFVWTDEWRLSLPSGLSDVRINRSRTQLNNANITDVSKSARQSGKKEAGADLNFGGRGSKSWTINTWQYNMSRVK